MDSTDHFDTGFGFLRLEVVERERVVMCSGEDEYLYHEGTHYVVKSWVCSYVSERSTWDTSNLVLQCIVHGGLSWVSSQATRDVLKELTNAFNIWLLRNNGTSVSVALAKARKQRKDLIQEIETLTIHLKKREASLTLVNEAIKNLTGAEPSLKHQQPPLSKESAHGSDTDT